MYLGSISAHAAELNGSRATDSASQKRGDYSLGDSSSIPSPEIMLATLSGKLNSHAGRNVEIFLPDSEERAIGYLMGSFPNRWGILENGTSVVDSIKAAYGITPGTGPTSRSLLRQMKSVYKSLSSASATSFPSYLDHPMFGFVALELLQDVSTLSLLYYYYSLVFYFYLCYSYKNCTSFL